MKMFGVDVSLMTIKQVELIRQHYSQKAKNKLSFRWRLQLLVAFDMNVCAMSHRTQPLH